MTLSDYYQILGLSANSSIEEIKRAYRLKARMYHPDINPSPDAKDKFIIATQAYEFLLAYHEKITNDEEAFRQAMDDWRKYRQDRSKQRANAYAQASYVRFKSTNFYRNTRIFDATRIIYSLIISILIIFITISGYIYMSRNPYPYDEHPDVLAFILLLIIGMSFFATSLVNLKAYMDASRKHKKKS